MSLTVLEKADEPLELFFKRLSTVIVNHDYNHYKAEHQSSETLLKVQKLRKLISSSPTITYEFSDYQINVLLHSLFASRDVSRCYTLLLFLCLSNDVKLILPDVHYKHNYTAFKNSEIKLSGMDNWSNVLCYFDSLIFAMFGRMEDYDGLLLVKCEDESLLVTEFKLGLRLLVNLIRSGEGNITIDIIQVVCKIFADLGFKEAVSKRQQDVVSCFETLCDYLNVPLLTLKIDIIHSGKVDIDDDLKYMSERVLFISVPEDKISDLKTDTIQEEDDTSNKMSFSKIMKGGKRSKKDKDDTIHLEDCLNDYFNNSIKVKRVLERRRTLTLERSNTLPAANNLTSRLTPESSSSTALENDNVSSDDTSSGEALIKTYGDDDGVADRDKDLLSERDLKERNDFLGAVSYTNDLGDEPSLLDGVRPNFLYPTPSRTSYHSMASSFNRSVDSASPFSQEVDEGLTPGPSNNSDNFQQANHHGRDNLKRTVSSPATNLSAFRSNSLRHSRRDSMSKINEIITLTRSRSSTDASILSMTPIIKRTNSTTLSHSLNSGLEVTLPAWMFLQLLPYYSDFGSDDIDDLKKGNRGDHLMSDRKASLEFIENTTKNDIVDSGSPAISHPVKENPIRKMYVNKRPIVPICLKRYIYNDKGVTQKINKKFNIPTVIDLPYFVADDRPTANNNEKVNKSFDQFRLVLESVVCHRGNSVDSGHYVSASRKHPYTSAKNKKNKEDEQVWLLFNDLKEADEKITETTFKQILDTEAPYLLFYRIEDYEFDPVETNEINVSSASTIRKVETADNSIISGSTVIKDKHLLDRISTGSGLDARDLRKNSVISTLSLVSSSLRKEKEEDLKIINSASSTAGSVLTSAAIGPFQSPQIKVPSESTPEDSKNGRHQHHAFSFTRSLSRSSSRPPMSRKDHVAPDSIEFIDFDDKFYWYYQTLDGTFDKQTKSDVLRIPVPVLRSPSYQTESFVSDSEATTTKDVESDSSTFIKDATPKRKTRNDDSTITTPIVASVVSPVPSIYKSSPHIERKTILERVGSPAASTKVQRRSSLRLPRRALTMSTARPKSMIKPHTVPENPPEKNKKEKKEKKIHHHHINKNGDKCVIM